MKKLAKPMPRMAEPYSVMSQISDTSALEPVIDKAIADNPEAVENYRSGKKKALGALVGQIMKAAKGKANPQQVNDLLKEKLG